MQTQKQGLKQYIGKANHGLDTRFKSENRIKTVSFQHKDAETQTKSSIRSPKIYKSNFAIFIQTHHILFCFCRESKEQKFEERSNY